jgi:RND family efflux transporter MFP subunit
MSATSASTRLAIRLIAALAVVTAAAAVVIVRLRPVAVVEPATAGEAIDARPGSVTVVEEYSQQLRSEIGGRVLRRDYNLDPGRVVHRDEILAQLDPGDLLLAMEQKRINYAATKASYAADHSAEMALEAARSDLANALRLNKLGSISAVDLERAQRAEKAQQQALELSRIDHDKVLATFETDLKLDQRKLEKMTIRSPLDGTVSAVFARPGDLIAAEAPVATLIATNKVVEGKVSEEDFAGVATGEQARVTFLPYGDRVFPGKVVKILPTADPDTQRHLVHIDVSVDPAHPLVPGINGEVIIIVGRREARVVVPRRAVFELDGKCVFVVKDGTVLARKVSVGYLWARGAEILSGLEPGETVIVDELENFRPGEKVRVREVPSDVSR